jgi:predicted RNA-binding protein YlqC (UPF0109 family)
VLPERTVVKVENKYVPHVIGRGGGYLRAIMETAQVDVSGGAGHGMHCGTMLLFLPSIVALHHTRARLSQPFRFALLCAQLQLLSSLSDNAPQDVRRCGLRHSCGILFDSGVLRGRCQALRDCIVLGHPEGQMTAQRMIYQRIQVSSSARRTDPDGGHAFTRCVGAAPHQDYKATHGGSEEAVPRFEVHVDVPNASIGRIIGKGGRCIKDIASTSGAIIKVGPFPTPWHQHRRTACCSPRGVE